MPLALVAALVLCSLMAYYNVYGSGTTKWKKGSIRGGMGEGEEFSALYRQTTCLPSTLKYSPTQKLSELCCLGFFMEVSLCKVQLIKSLDKGY